MSSESSAHRFHARVVGLGVFSVFVSIGIAAYWQIMPTFFVADDFAYLDAIQNAQSPFVAFEALAGRYFRPLVVFVYYINYQLSGLNPWSYHLSVVLFNAICAWLVFLFAMELEREVGRVTPFLAGLLFVTFGGHAEAVTWIGGMADPLVTLWALVALLSFMRALKATRPAKCLCGAWTALALGLLSKESAAIIPGLFVCLTVLREDRSSTRAWRTLWWALGGSAFIWLIYLWLRWEALGFAHVNLQGLGTNSNVLQMGRAFVLRSFIPQGAVLSSVFNHHLDVWLILPAGLMLSLRVARPQWRPLVSHGLCLGAALAPILPLSIAVATPESERLVYMASAFASLLLVSFLGAAIRHKTTVAVIVLLCAVGNVASLVRINRHWQEASAITRSALTSFGDIMRRYGRIGRAVYVLNVPDNVRGAYVFRRGFHEALRVMAPDQVSNMAQTYVLSVYSLSDVAAPVRITRLGSRAVKIDLGEGWLVGNPSPPSTTVALSEWATQSFVATFSEEADGDLILFFTPRSTSVVGRLPLD